MNAIVSAHWRVGAAEKIRFIATALNVIQPDLTAAIYETSKHRHSTYYSDRVKLYNKKNLFTSTNPTLYTLQFWANWSAAPELLLPTGPGAQDLQEQFLGALA